MQDKLHIAIHNIPVELRAQQQWLLNSISISPGAPGFPRFEAKTSLAQLEFQVTFLASWQTADLPPMISQKDWLWCREGAEFYPDMHVLSNTQELLFQDVQLLSRANQLVMKKQMFQG